MADLEERIAHDLEERIAHTDDMLHTIARGITRLTEVLDKHAPLLERAAALSNPGARMGAFLRSGKRNSDNPAE